MRTRVGKTYIFDSASQQAFDVWRRPFVLEGKHKLVKQKDTIMDRLHGRSWYVVDGKHLIFLPRHGYVEEVCLREE